MNKEKIAFVCQRYGLEVNGGAELECRLWAEKLTSKYEVEVYTTCALDYMSWENYYPEGDELIHDVLVHRYQTEEQRDLHKFGELGERVFQDTSHREKDEIQWIKEQGPVSNSLLKDLFSKQKEYKTVIFMTYLYYLSAMGLPMGFENAILIPTVHDEPPVHLPYYKNVFRGAKGFIWNTKAEKAFAQKIFPETENKPCAYAGVGVEIPKNVNEMPLPKELKDTDYIVYAGRVDESKGCREMFQSFTQYKKEYGRNIKLVVMGKEVIRVPKREDIVYLGFVSDEVKFKVLSEAKALVLFSKYESLSMVVLESMSVGRPVLVNAKCDVLTDHCKDSNAGLYFDNYREFAEELEYLLTHDEQYNVMCENGREYVEKNYRWDVIIDNISNLIEKF
ncbi:MAG: glycosyltransferase family 4 protein [Lachnospiraceae bacterium]|nr:glycosyltransferase family 4 protein [Lachnospiraceae bacterium]